MNCEKIDKYDYLIAMATLDAKNNDVEMFEKLDTSDVVLSDQVVRKINRLIKQAIGIRTSISQKLKWYFHVWRLSHLL